MRSRSPLLCTLVLTLWFAPPAFAQVPYDPVQDTTDNPLKSYHGSDIDSIELSTGLLSVNIPLVSYPQRGGILRLDYSLTYRGFAGDHSSALTIFDIPGQHTQEWSLAAFGHVGGTVGNGGVQITLANFPSAVVSAYTYNNSSWDFGQYWLLEQDGSSHPIGWMTTTQGRTLDSSGYYVGSTTFIDKNGVTFGANTVTDPNGNQITTSGNTVDTMGRQITYTPFSSGTWSAPGVNGTTENFVIAGSPTSTPETVALPNNTSYSFQFTPYTLPLLIGQNTAQTVPLLTQVVLPTGGSISYTYTSTVQSSTCSGTNWYFPVVSRTVNAADGTGPHTWTYAYANSSTASATTTVTDPLGNVTVYTYGMTSCAPYITQIQRYDNASHLLQTESRTYSTAGAGGFGIYNVDLTTITTLWPNGQQSQKSYTYDRDNGFGFTFGQYISTNYPNTYVSDISNATGTNYHSVPAGYTSTPWAVTETDYGNGSPGPTLRETKTTYTAFSGPSASAYLANNLLELPYTVQVLNGSGGQAASTQYGYDESPSPSCACGNQTSAHRWLNTTGASLSTTKVYNATGTVSSSKDANGNQTTYTYSSTYSGAYPTTITNALGQATNYTYDFNTGLLTSIADPNSQTTTYSYDNMLRLAQIKYPDGGQSTFTHQETSLPFTATVTKIMNSTQNVVQTSVFDGLGRVSETQLNSDPDCASAGKADTTYDGLGHVNTVSNPYCTTSDPTYGLTTYAHDALGRTTQLTHPDSTTLLTTYIGRATQVQDEGNGTQRVTKISQTDGLGRLASVCEVAPGPFVGANGASSSSLIGSSGAPVACGQDIAGTGFLTTYFYDPLSNLLQVNQSGISSRTFSYDSFSRLTSATNPESGTICYGTYSAGVCQGNGYDANGNLITKTAPAPNQTGTATVTTAFQYDALNRVAQKSYSDGTTPTVLYFYDVRDLAYGCTGTYTNLVGRLSGSAVPGWTFCDGYDPMGRLIDKDLRTPQNQLHYYDATYDLLGNILSETGGYSSVMYAYNTAARLTGVSWNWPPPGPGDSTNPISGIHYNALGSPTSDTLGDGEAEVYSYNKRGWQTSSTASLNSTNIYSFNINSFAPNGDILSANDSANGNWTYSYDPFNRLVGSNLNNGAAVYSYVYDRFGNRWQQNGPTNTFIATFTGNNQSNPQNNNRIDGYTHDAAGNIMNDGLHSYTFDAENRMINVDGGNTAAYVYDADGHRVQKTSATGNPSDPAGTWLFFYDQSGRWVQKSNSPGNTFVQGHIFAGSRHVAVVGGGTTFVHSDWLGTERARNALNNPTYLDSCTSLPFGDGLNCSGSGDLSNLHFTGKERDSESGLDNFGARYFGSSMARFMTPDPLLNSGQPWNPQSWNRYAYTENNPLRYTDPTGLYKFGNCSGTAEQCLAQEQRFRDSIAKAKEALKGLDPKSKEAKALQKTLNKLGDEDEGNIRINFGDAGKTDGQPNLGRTVGNSITINYDAVDSTAKAANLNASEAAALDAGVTTHEGTHAFGSGLFGFMQGHFEHPAYYTESVTYQGLHNTDKAFSLWNESWLTVDKDKLSIETHRENAIQNAIHPPKQEQKQENPQ